MLASPSIPGLRLAENDEAADIGMVSLDGRLALVDAGGRPFPAVPRFDPQESGFALSAVGAAAHLSRWLAIAELRSG